MDLYYGHTKQSSTNSIRQLGSMVRNDTMDLLCSHGELNTHRRFLSACLKETSEHFWTGCIFKMNVVNLHRLHCKQRISYINELCVSMARINAFDLPCLHSQESIPNGV